MNVSKIVNYRIKKYIIKLNKNNFGETYIVGDVEYTVK